MNDKNKITPINYYAFIYTNQIAIWHLGSSKNSYKIGCNNFGNLKTKEPKEAKYNYNTILGVTVFC